MDTAVLLAAVFLIAATHASASVIGGLEGTWYGACSTQKLVTVNNPTPKCSPGGVIIAQPYNVTFNADETWNWTNAAKQVKINGKNYKAAALSAPLAPLKFVKMLDTGFCADVGDAYIAIIRTVVKMATGGTLVMYEETGWDYDNRAEAYALGCPSPAMPLTCDPMLGRAVYRCTAIRQME